MRSGSRESEGVRVASPQATQKGVSQQLDVTQHLEHLETGRARAGRARSGTEGVNRHANEQQSHIDNGRLKANEV